jgi:hypothetical protein
MKTIQKLTKLIDIATDAHAREVIAEVYEAAKADFAIYQQNAGLIQRIVADIADVKGVYVESQPEIEATIQALRDAESLLKQKGIIQ